MKHVVTAAPFRQTILVTGFGAFPGHRRNPTEAILAGLERQRPRLARLGIDLRCMRVPVVYAGLAETLGRAADKHRPDAILHLGLAARRHVVSVETRALDRAGPLHPDAARSLPGATRLARGGAASLAATYCATRIEAALRRSGVPAARSIDAGDYVCNATLFFSLAGRLAPQIGFLHVPKPRDPAKPKTPAGRPRPTSEALVRATMGALLVMARGSAA